MRVLLVALNAKYVHTNLALRYLREGIRQAYPDVRLKEFTINDRPEQIAAELYEVKADVIGFSCYIWNLKEILAILRQLRPVCPNVRFVIGGPEVSFEAKEFLMEHPEADALVLGEGEAVFLELLQAWETGRDITLIGGLAARTETGKVIVNSPRRGAPDLNSLPFPYIEKEDFTGRLVYVETTRGCPFSCQYCLSSTFQGVRYLEPERFRKMFKQLLLNGARTIKFVDRTFNANKRHALKILEVVREEVESFEDKQNVRIHCEMAGDLLDQEWMAYLANYPRGLIQLEIGVQSTHEPTLEIVARKQNFAEWRDYVPKLNACGIPVHLDLIAGLPEENWADFRTSFNDVYAVEPDMLQLGFLKVLKGSGLRIQSKRYGLVFSPDPPYTILETSVMPHWELLRLRRIEDIVDKYYNSGKFIHALREAVRFFATPFDFYHGFAEFWQARGWFQRQWQGKALFDLLWEYLKTFQSQNETNLLDRSHWEKFVDALRFDYYLWERPNVVPDYLGLEICSGQKETSEAFKTEAEAIRRDEAWQDVIPEFKTIDRRQWYRNTAVACFAFDVLQADSAFGPYWYLFYYHQGKVKTYRYER